jgi:hypothetical protein
MRGTIIVTTGLQQLRSCLQCLSVVYNSITVLRPSLLPQQMSKLDCQGTRSSYTTPQLFPFRLSPLYPPSFSIPALGNCACRPRAAPSLSFPLPVHNLCTAPYNYTRPHFRGCIISTFASTFALILHHHATPSSRRCPPLHNWQ